MSYSAFSLELRELEAKLKAAYMNKERMAQMAEKEAVKYDVMVSPMSVKQHCITITCPCRPKKEKKKKKKKNLPMQYTEIFIAVKNENFL